MNISPSADMFSQWCMKWTKVDTSKSAEENTLVAGMFVIQDQENDQGINESVLKLYDSTVDPCTAQIESEESLKATLKLKEMQWGLLSPSEQDQHFGPNGDLLGKDPSVMEKQGSIVDSMKAKSGIGFIVHKYLVYKDSDPSDYQYEMNFQAIKFDDVDNFGKLHKFLNIKQANSISMNDDWNLIPDRSIDDIEVYKTYEEGRQFYDADFAKQFTSDYSKVGQSTVQDSLGVTKQAMENAGALEFNNDGNSIDWEHLKRAEQADAIVKYVFQKVSEGNETVDNGFEAGQIHKCTVFHNVLPRLSPSGVSTNKDNTKSFCCVGFGVRKTGNDGTIEQQDVCEKITEDSGKTECVIKAKTLQRRLLADCAAVNSQYAGQLTPPHLRKKSDEEEEAPAVPAPAKEDPDAGVTTSDKPASEEEGQKTKIFGAEEKKTLPMKTTQIDLKKPMHGPSKEFAPQQTMKEACLGTIRQVNPELLEIDDLAKKQEKEDKLLQDPRIAEEGSIQAKIERLFDRDYGFLTNSVQEELRNKAKVILDESKISSEKKSGNRFKDGVAEESRANDASAMSSEGAGANGVRKSNRVIYKRKNVMVDDRNFIDYQRQQNKYLESLRLNVDKAEGDALMNQMFQQPDVSHGFPEGGVDGMGADGLAGAAGAGALGKSLEDMLKELQNAQAENLGNEIFSAKDAQIKVKPDGTVVKVLANGDMLAKTPDGCKTFKSANGLVTTVVCEKATAIVKADGSKNFFNSAGTPISEEVFNGLKAGALAAAAKKLASQITPDGAQVDTFEDGTKVTTNPDGTQTINAPGQPPVNVKVNADGTQVATTADGKEAMVKDGAVVLKDPDGTVTNVKPDGTVEKVMADGTKIQESATQAVAQTAAGAQVVAEVDQETGMQATVAADAQGVVQNAQMQSAAAMQQQAAMGMSASAQAQQQAAAGVQMNADMSVAMGGAQVMANGTVVNQSGQMQTQVDAMGNVVQTNMATGAASHSAISQVSQSMQGGHAVSMMSDGSMMMNMSGGSTMRSYMGGNIVSQFNLNGELIVDNRMTHLRQLRNRQGSIRVLNLDIGKQELSKIRYLQRSGAEIIQILMDGTVVTQHWDGSRTVKQPDGSIEVINIYGKVINRQDHNINVSYDFNTQFGIMIKNMLSQASHRIGNDSWLSRDNSGALSEHTSGGMTLKLDDDGAKVFMNGNWEERCYPTGKGMRMNKHANKNELCDCSKQTGRVNLASCKSTGNGFNIMAMMDMLMGMGKDKKGKKSADEAAAAEAEKKNGGAFRTEALPEGAFNDLYHKQFGGVVSKNNTASMSQAHAINVNKNSDCENQFSPLEKE